MTDLILLARSGEAAKSGPLGLAVILVFCVVCYFLFKSMSKHLRNVRERFPQEQPPPAGELPERIEVVAKPGDQPESTDTVADRGERPPE